MGNGWRNLRLGRILGIPIYVSPTWFLVAAVITIGFEPAVARSLPGLGTATYAVTFAFAVLLYVSVFLHEVSHAVAARAFRLPVRGITLHFLGGHTEIERDSPTPGTDLAVSAAGPAVSLLLGGLAWLAARPVGADVPEYLLLVLATANGVVGLFNLLPALPLDGGHMLRAVVWRVSGDEHRGTVVAARAGQVLAVVVLLVPFALAGGRPSLFAMVWGVLVAMLLWTGATQSLAVARIRSRIPGLRARDLARPVLSVSPDQPVSEAVRTAAEVGATAMVVVDAWDRPTALVNMAAVRAIPDERRPWMPVSSVARALDDGMRLGLGTEGAALLQAMRDTPVPEYLVVDGEGAVYGVLVAADVDAALSAGGARAR